MKLDFHHFTKGTLFLVRTPASFPVGYADASFADMKHNLHFDFASLLETWNTADGTAWISDKFPRSSYWKDEPRDPLEECFEAADKYDMAFLPEAGVVDKAFVQAHPDGMLTSYDGQKRHYGRIGLVPACPSTLEYLIAKYDALLEKFGGHPSCQGICLPAENSTRPSYDKYTQDAWRKRFGTSMPSPDELRKDDRLTRQVLSFCEDIFLEMYRALARHLKQKFNLPLMHYPLSNMSSSSHMQPSYISPDSCLAMMRKVEELDVLNLQLHPPLSSNPYAFKFEAEFMQANCGDMPCIADTHFYHEMNAGRLPDMTPKRALDWILSTITPYGISFFCYGFMSDRRPVWTDAFKPEAPVFNTYVEPHTIAARREKCLLGMDIVEQIKPFIDGTKHTADCAIYCPEEQVSSYIFGSLPSEHLFGLHELFNAAAIPVKVTAKMPCTKAEQPLLVLSGIKELNAEEEASLKSYVADGGKVIVVGSCCESILSICGLDISESKGRFIASTERGSFYGNCWLKLPEAAVRFTEHAGTALHCYDNGDPAVTQKGNIVFIGVSCAVDRFSYFRDFNLATLWRELIVGLGATSGVSFNCVYLHAPNYHQFVSADIYGNNTRKLLLLRNFGMELDDSTLNWEIPCGMSVTHAFADGKEFAFANGEKLPKFEHCIAVVAELNEDSSN